MDRIFEIATTVSTPLALGGFFAAVVFFIFRQIVAKNIFPELNAALGADILKLIIERLFILALLAMVLGFVAYVVALAIPPRPVPPPSIRSEERTWPSPLVIAEITEAQARSLLGGGETAAAGASSCFAPPDTPPAEAEKGNWRFMPETASVYMPMDQHDCNSGQANIGGADIGERGATKICLNVTARPAQQGVYHCTTKAHFEVKITRSSQ